MISQAIETVAVWARYLYWSDVHRRRFDDYFREEGASDDVSRFLLHVGQWYASLWVVVEGWQTIGFEDHLISALLSNPNGYSDLLRRCRNGVYHFQPHLIEPKMSGILARPESLRWCHALHQEFNRWYWQYPERLAPDAVLSQQLRSVLRDLVGWIPEDSLWAEITRQELKSAEVLTQVGTDEGPEAKEVRSALDAMHVEIQRLRRRLVAGQQLYLSPGWPETEPTETDVV
jgi:hypothetical protein